MALGSGAPRKPSYNCLPDDILNKISCTLITINKVKDKIAWKLISNGVLLGKLLLGQIK